MHTKLIASLAGLSLAGLGGCTGDKPTQAEAVSAPAAAAVSEPAANTGAATAAPQDAAPAAPAGTAPASRAFIDPATGELRAPTAAELAASQASESSKPAVRPRTTVPETRLPDGTIMYDLRNQPQVEEKVCVQADGSIGACPKK